MSDPATSIAAMGAALVYISKVAYELVLKSKNGLPKETERSTCEARAISATVTEGFRLQNEILKEIKTAQGDTRDGVRDLVSMAKQERNRRG